MGKLIDVDKFLKRVKKDREHEIYLHSWTADMVLKRLDSWYAPAVEAIPKDQYEARLKADMIAILTDIQLEFEENTIRWYVGRVDGKSDDVVLMETINDIIQQKLNSLRGNTKHWIDNADSYICPICNYEVRPNPVKFNYKCPKCGFVDSNDIEKINALKES